MVIRAKTAYNMQHGYAISGCWCCISNAVTKSWKKSKIGLFRDNSMQKIRVHTFEADKAEHITAITVKLVPTTPVRDIKIDKAESATMGNKQYPNTDTTTVMLTGVVAIILKRPYVKDVFLPFYSPFLILATKTSNTVCLINKDYGRNPEGERVENNWFVF